MEWTWSISSINQVVKAAQDGVDECTKKPAERLFRIQISELSSSPEEKLAPILSALGLAYSDNHNKFYLQESSLRTASMSQVRRPLTSNMNDKENIPKGFK